jgi:formylmethanofuran dehydrogenase subunit E
MAAPVELGEDQPLDVSEVFGYAYQEPAHSFHLFVCEERGEMVVEEYGRIKQGKKVRISRAGKS